QEDRGPPQARPEGTGAGAGLELKWRLAMTKTVHGRVHNGKTIELDEDLGVAEGQEVEVQVKLISPGQSSAPTMSAGLAEVYAILGERFDTGEQDIADRHDEHQP